MFDFDFSLPFPLGFRNFLSQCPNGPPPLKGTLGFGFSVRFFFADPVRLMPVRQHVPCQNLIREPEKPRNCRQTKARKQNKTSPINITQRCDVRRANQFIYILRKKCCQKPCAAMKPCQTIPPRQAATTVETTNMPGLGSVVPE